MDYIARYEIEMKTYEIKFEIDKKTFAALVKRAKTYCAVNGFDVQDLDQMIKANGGLSEVGLVKHYLDSLINEIYNDKLHEE